MECNLQPSPFHPNPLPLELGLGGFVNDIMSNIKQEEKNTK